MTCASFSTGLATTLILAMRLGDLTRASRRGELGAERASAASLERGLGTSVSGSASGGGATRAGTTVGCSVIFENSDGHGHVGLDSTGIEPAGASVTSAS